MATGSLRIMANVTGSPVGSVTFDSTVTSSASVINEQTVALSSGNNTITIPTGVTTLVIAPPNSLTPAPNPPYAGTLTLKGVNGDTGIAISSKWPTVLDFDAATQPASIVINASVSGTIYLWTQ